MSQFIRKALLLAALGPAAAAADSTSVSMGGAVTLSLPRNAAHVVVSNPAVADVTLQSPRLLVLFGKYPGGSTLLVTDSAGNPILNTSVLVTAADGQGVTIHYGTGKNWSPGGAVASAACGSERCAPTVILPPPAGASPGTAAAATPAPPAIQTQH